MTDRRVTVFAPATVSNVACGFDVLGFAIERPGDEVTARFAEPGVTGVTIDGITGDGGRLPREAARNTAGVAAQALLTAVGERRGVVISIAILGWRRAAWRPQRDIEQLGAQFVPFSARTHRSTP
jgi:homoserine kinase